MRISWGNDEYWYQDEEKNLIDFDWVAHINTTFTLPNKEFTFYPVSGVEVRVSRVGYEHKYRFYVKNTNNWNNEKPVWVQSDNPHWREKLVEKIKQKKEESLASIKANAQRQEGYEKEFQLEQQKVQLFNELTKNHPLLNSFGINDYCSYLKYNGNSFSSFDIDRCYKFSFDMKGFELADQIKIWEEINKFLSEVKNKYSKTKG